MYLTPVPPTVEFGTREMRPQNFDFENQWNFVQEKHSAVGNEGSVLNGLIHRTTHPGMQCNKQKLEWDYSN